MSAKIDPRNKTVQLLYRAAGNPSNTLPSSAISNCFPGLEYDFKNFWRRAFVGIVLQEWDNYVVEIEDEEYKGLRHHRLLRVDGHNVVAKVSGPQIPGGPSGSLGTGGNPNAVMSLEWSNALAYIMQRKGHAIRCHFTLTPSDGPLLPPVPDDTTEMLEVHMTVRQMFDGESVAPAKDVLQPGELTQGLCSPWQHDYRECSCYYWPASRPDYVNVESTPEGVSRGDNWLSKAKERPAEYILDDRKDGRLITYDDLFKEWEKMLRFQIKGRDAEET